MTIIKLVGNSALGFVGMAFEESFERLRMMLAIFHTL